MAFDAHFELRHSTFSTAIFCRKTKKSHAKNREWTRRQYRRTADECRFTQITVRHLATQSTPVHSRTLTLPHSPSSHLLPVARAAIAYWLIAIYEATKPSHSRQ